MWLSDIAVRRPVFATVISVLLIVFGVVAFDRLPLREYPDIDVPIVSIETNYRGASAAVVESRLTQVIEDRLAGIEGLRTMTSTSRDGRSTVTLEFSTQTHIDVAANDVRDVVSGLLKFLPSEADAPTITKVDANASAMLWLTLVSDRMSVLELTDYARRYLVDRFSSLDGVARVRVGGGLDYALRIWIDRHALAARSLTVADIERALRSENVELPAGFVESVDRQYTVRIERSYRTPDDFGALILAQGADGHLVRLRDVARVEFGADEWRTLFRSNGKPMVGIGIIKQSTANMLAVSAAVKQTAQQLNLSLPAGMHIDVAYDASVFVDSAIGEVYQTLIIAGILVIITILLFLRSWRATLVPAVTVPITLVASFILLYALGFSINLLTLLALVLAVGLVVDDAIVVLENVHRHIELGEPPLLAAYRGTREVGFAVIATTLVLVSVFVPITFLQGQVGKLFAEFAVALTAAVIFSSIVALTLSPVLASFLLRKGMSIDSDNHTRHVIVTYYQRSLAWLLKRPWAGLVACLLILLVIGWGWQQLPQEFAPREDRGAFFMLIDAPQGSSFHYTAERIDEIEQRLMPMVETGDIERLLLRAPRSIGAPNYAESIAIIMLPHWDSGRPSADAIIQDIMRRVADVPGVSIIPIMPQGLRGGISKPIQFALGGPDYNSLAQWRDILLAELENYPGVVGINHNYHETKPQLRVVIDSIRAGDLGVSILDISQTLETLLGSRTVTTFIDRGEEYDVILEGEIGSYQSPQAIAQLQVRSQRSGELVPLANLIHTEEFADASALSHTNRVRSITFDGNLAEGYSLGEVLNTIDRIIRDQLPSDATIDFQGESREYKESGHSVIGIFILSIVVVYLILAALFESFVHPFIILFGVPLALVGALLALWISGGTINIYTQVAIIMLVGLAAKNGILIVEFANQLRDKGYSFEQALMTAAGQRMRPIIMTGLTTVLGALPLIMASGAGAETRTVIGWVVLGGVGMSTLLTLWLIPSLYSLLARRTQSPGQRTRDLHQQQALQPTSNLPTHKT